MDSLNETRIVFTTDTIRRGGKERQLFILVKNLLEKGYSVNIVTKKFSKDNYLDEYGLTKEIIKVYHGETWIKRFISFKQIALAEKPDYIISWDLETSIFNLFLYKKHGFIFINASIQHGIRLIRFSHILRSLVCFLSPYIIANSYAGLKANNLKPGRRRFVLYNGIENKFKNTLSKVEIESQRRKLIPGYSVKQGTVYISIANLVPFKDYSTVLKALNKLKERDSFYYLIVGDGPMRSEIIETIEKYRLEKRIFLIGEIENVIDYLFISDIMIHSSRGEGISNSILEGMYAGLPVIATNVGGIPETVFSGSSMLFNYKDNKALMECLIKASITGKNFNSASEEYLNHLNKFSISRMINRFEVILINCS
jgi:glycosyltransferase involved in cell wall biosynthesis